jgi:hypothetical protein
VVNLWAEKAEEKGGQQVSGDKTCKQEFFRNGLCIFNNSGQEFLHERVFGSLDAFRTLIVYDLLHGFSSLWFIALNLRIVYN